MTYTTTYEFTAFAEDDLASDGNLSCGDTFKMPASATVCFEVTDNDSSLSGDSCHNENANDHSYQTASITDALTGEELGNGGQIYGESYWWVHDDAGNWYILIEIEQEGSGEDYFTFYTGHGYAVPADGTHLTVHSACNISSWEPDFKCLDAGDKIEPGTITGTVWCDVDCDGIQDTTVTVTKGHNILKNGSFANNDHTEYNTGGYKAWYDIGGTGDIVNGTDQAHNGNRATNELWELDKGSILCQEFHVDAAGKFCLDFKVFDNHKLDAHDDSFKVKINGQTVETVVVEKDGHVSIELHLDAGQNRIDFVSLSTVHGKGAGIDSIKLRPLIETEVLSEPVKEGVTIKLVDLDGTVVATTLTDADGTYEFDEVAPGQYKIMGVAPDGTEFTIQDAGNDNVDSDVDATGMSGVLTVASGGTVDVDLGLKEVKLGALSGRYFCDDNRDDTENNGQGGFDAGVGGKTVTLFTVAGVVVATTTTDSNGNYRFDNLEAGDYFVEFESSAAEGKSFIAPNQGGTDTEDSDVIDAATGGSETVTVRAGEETKNLDAGVRQDFRVCDDPDAVNLDFEGFAAGTVIDDEYAQFGVTISAQRVPNNDPANDAMIFDSANPTGGDGDLATGAQGNILIVSEDNDSSDPDDAIGGTITVSFENPSEIFDLKVVDAEEGGSIALFDADGNSLGTVAIPNGVDGGLQQVIIDTQGVSEMVVTLNGSGAIDDICIVPGEPPLGSLSGRYFCDDNGDGLDNDGVNGGPSDGLEFVLVQLLDANGVPTGATTETDADGNYQFTDLAPGTYGVRFTAQLNGKVLTAQNQGDNDAIDSDAALVGLPEDGVSEILDIPVVAGQDTPDNDAGVLPLGSIAGRYFCDDNRDDIDNGEPGVNGLTITLTDLDTGETRTTTTATIGGVDGAYFFGDLAAGRYQVTFPADPTGKTFVAPNDPDGNGDDTTDSDAVLNSDGTASSQIIPLGVGEAVTDVDAGVENLDPEADDDAGEACYDEAAIIDVLDGDVDGNGDTLNVVAINGEAFGADNAVTLANGIVVTLLADGTLSVDGENAVIGGEATADLLAGEILADTFQYTVSDGEGGSDTANVTVTFKGATDTLAKFAEALPDQLCFTIADIPADATQEQIDAFFQLTLETDDANFAFLDNLVIDDAYCVDISQAFFVEEKVVADVTILADGFVGAGVLDPQAFDHFDEINWVLNNRDHADLLGFNDAEIQGAIWGLTNGNAFVDEPFFGSTANALAAQQVIETLGDGFELSFGDKVAVLLDPVDNDPSFQTQQPFVVALDNFWEDCIC